MKQGKDITDCEIGLKAISSTSSYAHIAKEIPTLTKLGEKSKVSQNSSMYLHSSNKISLDSKMNILKTSVTDANWFSNESSKFHSSPSKPNYRKLTQGKVNKMQN